MNKVKLWTILKYVLVCVIIIYSTIKGSLYLKDYLNSDSIRDLISSITFYVVTLISVVALIFLIKKSLYKRKFTHNDFQ